MTTQLDPHCAWCTWLGRECVLCITRREHLAEIAPPDDAATQQEDKT